jgi:hypothetical protein
MASGSLFLENMKAGQNTRLLRTTSGLRAITLYALFGRSFVLVEVTQKWGN